MHMLRSHQGSFFPAGVAGSLALLIACGGAPSAPTATPRLSILSTADVVTVGAFADMQLQIVFADGRITMITPVWSTDRPEIVHVKPLSASKQAGAGEGWDTKTGTIDHMLFARVTGLAVGDARVIAESSYGTAARPIRVVRLE
jgi:hypothetical protein